MGLCPSNVRAVACTHGHWDHVRGAAVLARRHDVEILGTKETLSLLRGDPPEEKLRSFPVGGRFAIGGLTLSAVPTMHDSPGSCGFVIDDGESRLGVITDLGVVTENVVTSLEGLDGLVLEMNHDEKMLRDGSYPGFLKARIRGEMGHLSNKQGADLLARLAHSGLQHLTLAHLSEENNKPEIALEMACGILSSAGIGTSVSVARASCPIEPVALERNGQLALGPW